MNCLEAESLFDAHLDGELTGALRLEFDAHRLRCRACQQQLAMLETCQNMLAGDSGVRPALTDDFTDRIMQRVATAPQPRLRVPRRFVTPVAAAVPAAAALLLFAFLWRSEPAVPAGTGATATPAPPAQTPAPSPAPPGLVAGDSHVRGFRELRDEVFRPFEQLQAASARFQTDLGWLGRVAESIRLPDEPGGTLNPVQQLLNILLSGEFRPAPGEDEASL